VSSNGLTLRPAVFRGVGSPTLARFLTALVLAVTVLGCTPTKVDPHDPTLAGVVQSRQFIGPQTATFTLAGERSVEIDLESTHSLRPEGTEPNVGDLLLHGVDAGRPWFVAVPPTSSGCELRVRPVAPSSGRLMFDFGLRLPLASNDREADYGQLDAGAPVRYLINDHGEVIERR
jgi:hypothetical protein